MPKVIINDSQGLIQRSGSGVEISSVVSGQKDSVSLCDSGQTLTVEDSGKVFLLVQAAGARTVTLPSVVPGLRLTFILNTAAAGNWSIVQAGATQDFVGTVLDGAGTSDSAVNTDTLVRFVGGTAVAGDQIELVCSDEKWFIRGNCAAAGGIIFA